MISYYYLALNQEGRKIKGIIEANNVKGALTQLKPRGLTIISLKKSYGLFSSLKKKSANNSGFFGPRVRSKDIIVFFRQFATIIDAGLPIVQALDIMIRQTSHSTLKKKIIQIKEDVETGMPLSEALAKHTKIFSSFICNMVKAGEAGGVLDVILARLAGYLESTDNIIERTKSALRYPVFVMFMAVGLIAALVFFVLPKMKTLFVDSFQAKLPALTQFILDLSDFIRLRFYLILIIMGVLGLIYYFAKNSDKGAYFLDMLKLKVPILGKIYHKICLSRFARTLAILSNSGIPILNSLDMTAKTTGNKIVEKAIAEVKSSLKEGETIAEPLKNCPMFPSMVVSMISVGEKTGALDIMLNKISDFYDQEIEIMVESLTSLIEPLLLGFLGVTIGIAVIAMYLPYFSIFQYIGG